MTLGDYIDRGPHSRGVIERLAENPFPGDYIALKGNHEALFEAFLADPAPDKRARLVHELLQDDRGYATNWLSFWNDLLRNDYRGTGFIDGGRKQITEWLYDALLTNKPYQQFVAELVNPSDQSLGFTAGIIWRGTGLMAGSPTPSGSPGLVTVPTPSPA